VSAKPGPAANAECFIVHMDCKLLLLVNIRAILGRETVLFVDFIIDVGFSDGEKRVSDNSALRF